MKQYVKSSSEFAFEKIKATDEDIQQLTDEWAFAWEGMDDSDRNLSAIVRVLTQDEGFDMVSPIPMYVWEGQQFNELYGLTGDNAYPDDLTFVAIPLNAWKPGQQGKLALTKMKYGARWLYDIVANNAVRQEEIDSGRY